MSIFSTNGNIITVNNKITKFNYPIYKAEENNNLIIVLLEFKNDNNPLDFINALYGISSNGKVVWKMEDVRNVLGKLSPDPLVDFNCIDDKIVAFDFSSRKYIVNSINGKILDFQTGQW